MADSKTKIRAKKETAVGPVAINDIPEQTPVFYTNSVQIRVSPIDFAFKLMAVGEMTQENKVAVRTLGTVFMSPQHALELTEILVGRLKEYEEKYGRIPRAGK